MNGTAPASAANTTPIKIGAVVRVESSLAEIQMLDGQIVAAEALGPGVVQEVGPDGSVRVHWAGADLNSWARQEDLLLLGDTARLLTVRVFDKLGRGERVRHRVVKGAGLRYNWVVEWRPKNIIRTVRPDGATWTFDWNPLFREVNPIHTLLSEGYQLDDDQAEAITVAELAANAK